MRSIVADTHVHLYPFYRMGLALSSGAWNLKQIEKSGSEHTRLLFLAERQGFSVFKTLDNLLLPGWEVNQLPEPNVALAKSAEYGLELLIINGRQIATKERLEVLSLAAAPEVPDGLEARQTVEEVLAAGGIPVIPWAFGKWMFKRRQVVESLLESFKPNQLLIGDTSTRAAGFPRPALMRKAAKKGFKIVAGTDPLPLEREEMAVGRYGIEFMAELGGRSVCDGLRKSLLDPASVVEIRGKRNFLPQAMIRLFKNSRSKPQTPPPGPVGVMR